MSKQLIFILVTAIFLLNCSPSNLYKKGFYHDAVSKSASAIERGKDVEENASILKASADRIVMDVMEKNEEKIASTDVKQWIKSHKKYYSTLSFLAKNGGVEGQSYIKDSYDKLCESKVDLDFKIVDHFYTKGTELLNLAESSGEKAAARDGYGQFEKCLEFEGNKIYNDISKLKEKCIPLGTVYFDSNGINPKTSLFFQPAKHENPDCKISSSIGFLDYQESISEELVEHTEEVISGYNTITDTSGVVTQEPIVTKVLATETIVTYDITASKNVNVYSKDLTGHCNYNGWSRTITESEKYKVVSFSGDTRAYPPGASNSINNYSSIRSDLERDIDREIDNILR